VTDYDVVIVGGAAMGASTAYHLSLIDSSVRVAVVERDSTYERSSTVLSDGNVRLQFNLEENILISMHALDVLATFADDMSVDGLRPEVSARHQGNLFLTDNAGLGQTQAGIETQQALGCDVVWMDAEEIYERWPAYAAEGIVGGAFGARDGSVDPGAVLRGYRNKAASQGVDFVEAEVAALTTESGRVTGLATTADDHLSAPTVINCAGAWGPALARTIGVKLPVEPVIRNVYVVETRVPTRGLPSVFLPSGLYAIPEHGATFAMGWSRPDDPVGFDFVFDRSGFERRIWPELAQRMPAFEALHVASGWAGLYAMNTLDGNAIVGRWPTLGGFYVCTGFSGHGFQQAPAIGRYLAECVLDIEPTLDLSRLGPQRVIDGEPLHEHAGRII
jgi:glycine/D-amino acid oxidase-like deaminating enzyme